MRVDLSCAVCGNNRFSLSEADKDTSMVWCEDCGHKMGTLAELKQRMADEVLKRAAERA